MALADKIAAPPPPTVHGLPCSIGSLIAQLDGPELAALNTMLYDLGWNAGQVYDALRDEGYAVGRQSINRHRGRKCRCFKDAA
jgi:hypothetical protein